MKTFLTLTIMTLLTGCAGKIYTVENPKFVNGQTEGVLFYGYKPVEKRILLDRIRNKNTGVITHSMYEVPGSPNFCAPDFKITKVLEADYSRTYAIKYKAGLFETNKFSVALENGTLKSVNSESTPGLKTAVESLQGIATLREDVLDGITSAADSSNSQTMSVLDGRDTPQATPIKCSANE